MSFYSKDFSARLKNVFTPGTFEKRYGDNTVQIKTLFGRVIEKKESLPYGFAAKAKGGKALALCVGGNFDAVEILPICAADDITPPELHEGDAALYTQDGGWVICRNDGAVELNGTNEGGVVKAAELKTQLDKMTARVDGIMNALKNSPTTAQDGGSAYKAAIATALNFLTNKEDFSGLESEKVLHGN
jgi:phage gp45-like